MELMKPEPFYVTWIFISKEMNSMREGFVEY
jgi:hypothetical protein